MSEHARNLQSGRSVWAIRLISLLHLAIGVLLLLSSWNDLYSALDLPRPEPALFAQVGGAFMLARAAVLANGARSQTLEHSSSSLFTGAFGDGLAALIVAAWLLFRDLGIWGVDTLGYVLLAALAVLLAASAFAQAWIALGSPQRPSRP